MLHKKQLPSTSKIYPKYYQNGTFAKNEEYFYRGERYVCVKTCSAYFSSHPFYNDGTELKNGDYEFFKVEPIKWEIRNWDEMPKEINPNSNGTAKFMDVVSQKAFIGGIPYSINVFDTYGNL